MVSIPKFFNLSKRNITIAACFVLVIAATTTFATMSSNSKISAAAKQEIANLEKVVRQNPHDVDTRVAMALAYYRSGAEQKAIAQLKTALQLNPSHQGATLLLADIYMDIRRFDKAIPYYKKVIEVGATNPMHGLSRELEGAYYQLGNAYLHLGKNADAATALEAAIAIDAADADAWYLLGTTCQKIGQFEKAIDSFKQAVLFVPNFKEAYQGLAECYDKTGQASYALYARAMTAYSSGALQETITQLNNVIAQKSDFTEAYLGLGLAYEGSGQKDKAKEAYQQTLALDPNNWLATSKLGR